MSSILDSIKDNEDLCNNLIKIEELAKPILTRIKDTFPEYTNHDIEHSKTVIDILNWLLPDSLITKYRLVTKSNKGFF